MITWETDDETVHALLVGYLTQRKDQDYQKIADVLKRGVCRLSWEGGARLSKKQERWVPEGPITYILTAFLQPDDLHLLEVTSSFNYGLLCGAFCDLITESHPQASVAIKALVELPSEGTGLNNCFFKKEQTITHEELRFRSRAEVVIYDELKRRNILFFPNPAAVLGSEITPELIEKREPDFLICSKGKWGILEVNGEPFHSGPVTTAKDHERFRLFQRHGLTFVQAYDADRCKREPARVVTDFLKLLEQSR